jgi:hypothetical protein
VVGGKELNILGDGGMWETRDHLARWHLAFNKPRNIWQVSFGIWGYGRNAMHGRHGSGKKYQVVRHNVYSRIKNQVAGTEKPLETYTVVS